VGAAFSRDELPEAHRSRLKAAPTNQFPDFYLTDQFARLNIFIENKRSGFNRGYFSL